MSISLSDYTVSKDVAQPMRDGTSLYADVYLPNGEGPFPTLLERTPYSKDNSAEVNVGAPKFFASRGYAVVIQDVRGCFKSKGRFTPFHDDGWGSRRDGYDTIEWIAAQKWCNGEIGTIGGSYSGATQYALAPTRPPHLRAMFVRESAADYWSDWVYCGGAFELAFMLGWTVPLAYQNLKNLANGEDYERHKRRLEEAIGDMESRYCDLPLSPNPLLTDLVDWYNDLLAQPNDGAFWWQWNVERQHHQIDTPIYHLGGWFDIFLKGTLKNFVGIRANAPTKKTRDAQRMIVGPWTHGPLSLAQSVQGEVDFGPAARRDFNRLRLPWFDYWLKGIQNGVLDGSPVQLFVMGENSWRSASDYPLPNTRYVSWYLHQSRTLRQSAPRGSQPADSYRYDPKDPVPTLGGCTLNIPNGPLDQRPIEGRCLTYTSDALPSDLTIIGNVVCTLYGMSSAPDTDWVVRLTDVHPDGYSRPLCDGVLRARFRRSRTSPQLLKPHEAYEFNIDLSGTANTFRAGHRIRVAVTSSSFPRFDRNLNTGGGCGTEVRGEVAVNTVFHDSTRPSRVILPTVD